MPVLMGSAFKNKGVQLVLDAILDYLPSPSDKENLGFLEVKEKEREKEERQIVLLAEAKLPFVGYAFKIEENKFGVLTYVRVYQGRLRKGEYIFNTAIKRRLKVQRMIKMHANQMEDITEVSAGEIFAIFGIECSTGDTLCEGDMSYVVRCTSMFVPSPVISYSIHPTKNEYFTKFNKALQKFQREDPTFRVANEKESEEIIISGMGELHLQIYAERMRREFNIEIKLGNPTVNYRETIAVKTKFEFLHKKQSGGAGQYAKVIGYLEPLEQEEDNQYTNKFVNKVIGTTIPNEYIGAVEKGFNEAVQKVRLLFRVFNITGSADRIPRGERPVRAGGWTDACG